MNAKDMGKQTDRPCPRCGKGLLDMGQGFFCMSCMMNVGQEIIKVFVPTPQVCSHCGGTGEEPKNEPKA